ncbi:MAG: hypothetical protein PHN69_04115 [Candidatus Pacebacteria bacterium]|nr:hypothetical protein [Candidatus Paceibacterota bacterium]
MVMFNGKEITQEQFDNMMAEMNNFKTLSEVYEKKTETLENKVKEFGDLQTELKSKEEKLYEVTLNSRLNKISKYLDSKGKDSKLIKKIGDMSDEDYELFIDGRTDDVFTSKEEIEFAKADLEKEKNELETNKDKIVKDAIKQFETNSKTRNDQKLVPDTEIDAETETETVGNGFPTMEALEKVFRLRDNPIWADKTDSMKQRAVNYMETYGGIDTEE